MISRNFVVNMMRDKVLEFQLDKGQGLGISTRRGTRSCHFNSMRDKVLPFQLDKRFMCDRNVLEKVFGGTAVPEKWTENCVPQSTRDSITFEETRHFKRYRTSCEGNITGEYKSLACLNDNIQLEDGKDEDEILEGNSQADIKDLVPIDKITTNDREKPFLNQTRTTEYMVNAESKADSGTCNFRSQISNNMDTGICWIRQKKGKGPNEITRTSELTNKNVSLNVDRPVRTRHVLHCGLSRQGRKRKTLNSSAIRPKRRSIDISSDQSQEDDLVFLKMELKDPVVVVEKLGEHTHFNDEVRCKRNRIKLEPIEGEDKIHSKLFQTDSIRFRKESVMDTNNKVERRKNKRLEENRGHEDMREKLSDSRQADYGGDGPKQMNNKPKPSELTGRTGHKKQFDLHQQADLPTLNVPCQKNEEEVVFLGMKLNDSFVVLGDVSKNTNCSQDHQYQRKKIKLESTLEDTARETIQSDLPSHTARETIQSDLPSHTATKNGKCNERAREVEKQNHCPKATITGMRSERPVCIKKCESPGEIIHEASIQGVEYKASFSCDARKRMSQQGLYRLHNIDGVLKDFYLYLLNERCNRTTHAAQMSRSVGKILFYLNPQKIELTALKNKTKLVQLYQELKSILKASSITIFIRSLYLFIEFLETMTTEHINFNSVKATLKNLKRLNTRCVQKEMAHRHFNLVFKNGPTSTDLSHQLKFSERLMTREIEKAKQKHKFSLCKVNTYFYMLFAYRHFQRKCVFENLTIEEWNERRRHTMEMEETHVILAIKNHKTLSSQLAMIALSEEEEEQMKDYLKYARPKSLQKEFFLTSTGNKIRDASHLLTYYQKIYKLGRITGTQARRILETSAWNIHDIEKRSICDYLCHSTRVAEKYYRLKTPQSCVYARKVVQKLINAAQDGCL